MAGDLDVMDYSVRQQSRGKCLVEVFQAATGVVILRRVEKDRATAERIGAAAVRPLSVFRQTPVGG